MEKTIDARGLLCPQPVIMTKKELQALDEGRLTVLVDNGTAAGNIEAFAEAQGLTVQTGRQGADYAVTVHKCGGAMPAAAAPATTVILAASDKFGSGDDEFSATLTRNFIFALTEAEPKPASMIFLNSGAHLTCEGSPVLESLRLLYGAGVEILTCGACLDFYELKNHLAVGEVTNMYVIAEKLLQAGSVIKI